jgi:hypothetical protein
MTALTDAQVSTTLGTANRQITDADRTTWLRWLSVPLSKSGPIPMRRKSR